MKKKIILLGACLIIMTGCTTEAAKLKDGSESVVDFKGLDSISANTLYIELKERYGTELLIEMMDTQILEKEFKDKLEEAEENADNQIAQLEVQLGDDLEAAIQQQTSYNTIAEYKEFLRINFLRGEAITEYAETFITDKAIDKHYEDEIVGDIKIHHILISPKVTEDMTDEKVKEAEEKAKKEVENLIAKLKKVDKKKLEKEFIDLAKEHSQDSSTKDSGGNLGYINKDTLGTSYDELTKAAYKLKDGEYSTKVITTELGYHIVLRLDTKEKADLKDVKEDILETLTNEYITENTKVTVEAFRELRKKYDMEINDKELEKEYGVYIQNALLNIEKQEESQEQK